MRFRGGGCVPRPARCSTALEPQPRTHIGNTNKWDIHLEVVVPVSSIEFDGIDLLVDGQTIGTRIETGQTRPVTVAYREPWLHLLPETLADGRSGRKALYVCSECGDLGCGGLLCVVEAEGDRVVWRDFAWDATAGEEDAQRYPEVGPFYFERAAYEDALAKLRKALQT